MQIARRSGEVTVDGVEEWVKLRAPLELCSLVGNNLVRSQTMMAYKGKSDTLVRLRTRSGKSVRVTPVHGSSCSDRMARYARLPRAI